MQTSTSTPATNFGMLTIVVPTSDSAAHAVPPSPSNAIVEETLFADSPSHSDDEPNPALRSPRPSLPKDEFQRIRKLEERRATWAPRRAGVAPGLGPFVDAPIDMESF